MFFQDPLAPAFLVPRRGSATEAAIQSFLGPALAILLGTTVQGVPATRLQPGVFAFRSYGMEDGLRNLAAFAIAQDAEGFLWVGSEDGLYRYDGHRFGLWRAGLKSTTIWDLAAGPGGVWALTDDGAYEVRGPRLDPVPGLPAQRPAFAALGPGGAAVAGFGDHLYGRDRDGAFQVLKTFPGAITAGWGSPGLDVLYVATEDRVFRRKGGRWSSQDLPTDFHGTSCRIFQDRSGRLYVRSRSQLWRRDWDGPWVDLSRGLPGNTFNVYPPAEDALGRIWVGTSKGLACFDGDETWVLGEAKGLPGGWAGPVFIDREGSLWAGSEGVHKLKGRFLWTNFGVHQGLPAPNCWDLGRSLDGRLFACTDSGIALLKGETWSLLPGTEGRTLLAGGGNGRDSIWFGGSGRNEPYNAVFRYDLQANRLEKVSIRPCNTNDLVLAITSGPAGGAYLGTRYEGVFQVRRERGAWVTERLPFPDRPGGERINGLRKDAQGRLWAATEHGLGVLEDGRWTRLGPAEGLLGRNCTSLARDPGGSVWVSYSDARGISRVGKAGGAWRVVESLTGPEALFDDAISSMLYDPAGVLWLGTAGGMKRWDGRSLEVFGRGDGLASQDTSANGIAIDPDGGLWQGFSNGISYFQPRAYRGAPRPPEARILSARDSRGDLPLAGPAPKVAYRDHTLAFQFSALAFANETKLVHEVRLVGLENDWRETEVNEARYAALPDGAYRFEVRSRFQDGQPGPVAAFAFRVAPAWWGTWWFRGLALLAAGGAALLAVRRRTAHLSDRNAQLEHMVALRTEALEASKLELEKANRALEETTLVDPLTGLHNRRYLDLALPTDALQAQRAFRDLLDAGLDPLEAKEDLLLFVLDLDHFKEVNDTYGHLAGDALLKQLAAILRSTTRATDALVRWGGEEFVLVARRTRRGDAPGIAGNLLDAVRSHTFRLPGGVELRKTWSIGFAALPVHPRHPELTDWQQALQMADQCLYAAKNAGRDRWVGVWADPEADPAPLFERKSWDVGWAVEAGLVETLCSEPAFVWPMVTRVG